MPAESPPEFSNQPGQQQPAFPNAGAVGPPPVAAPPMAYLALIYNQATGKWEPASPAPLTGLVGPESITEAMLVKAVAERLLGPERVIETMLAGAAVSSAKLANGAITTEKIGELQVTQKKLASASVSTEKLGAGQVTSEKLAEGAGAGAWEAIALGAKIKQLPTLQTAGARTEGSQAIVRLRGGVEVKVGEELKIGETIATLPVGFRPPHLLFIPTLITVAGVPTLAVMEITEAGIMKLSTNAVIGGQEIVFDGITFNRT